MILVGALARLRASTPETFAIGYSADRGAAQSLLTVGDAWYSAIAALLPGLAPRLTRVAQAGQADEATTIDAPFELFWGLLRDHGSRRIMYAIAERLSLDVGDPPLPLKRMKPHRRQRRSRTRSAAYNPMR